MRRFAAADGVMHFCNTNEFGAVDAAGTGLLAHVHEDQSQDRAQIGLRGVAAAVVALELGFGGRPRVAMA